MYEEIFADRNSYFNREAFKLIDTEITALEQNIDLINVVILNDLLKVHSKLMETKDAENVADKLRALTNNTVNAEIADIEKAVDEDTIKLIDIEYMVMFLNEMKQHLNKENREYRNFKVRINKFAKKMVRNNPEIKKPLANILAPIFTH